MRFQRKNRSNNRERGYILLTLLLIIALMIIFTAVIVPSITFEIKRDKEEEMIHRGVQYSRAIRAFYRKFGRYPAKIEDLENTNQLRFLRKRYKDPLTGKDFKLLHFGEAKMGMGGMGGGVIPGASTLGANGQLTNPNGPQSTSAFGNSSGFGGNSNTAFGQNSGFGTPQNSNTTDAQTSPDSTQAASDSAQNGLPTSGTGGNSLGLGTNSNSSSGDKLAGTTFGGAPIVGVASTSKDKTIREFDKKKKYNEWQFVYDPTFDRGQLITTPYQPSLQQLGMQGNPNVNGPNGPNGPGQNGINNSGFGNSFGNGFGNPQSPVQNNPNLQNNNPNAPNNGIGNPTQPPSLPPEQQ